MFSTWCRACCCVENCGFPPFRCGYLSGEVRSKLRAAAVLAAAYTKADRNAVCLYHLMLQLKLTAAAKSEGNIVLVDIEEIVDGV